MWKHAVEGAAVGQVRLVMEYASGGRWRALSLLV